MNSNQNPRDNRDLYETPWCKAGWKVTFNMLTTFPLCPRKKTKRPTEKGCAPPTDEPNCYICLRFFDVVLRHFLLWLSLMPHARHVEAYRVTFVYIVSTLFYVFFWGVSSVRMAQKPGFFIHGSPLAAETGRDLCAVSGVSPVGNEALLAVRNSWNQSIRGWITPIQPNMLAAIDVCNKKRSLPEDRSSTKAWNPEKHCF